MTDRRPHPFWTSRPIATLAVVAFVLALLPAAAGAISPRWVHHYDGPDHLTDGGWLQVLSNWAIVGGQPWDERLGSWLREDCDALVVQRETLDPASYVELWLKDSGHHGGPDYAARYDTWLSWLEETGIEGVGFGWINVHKTGDRGHDSTYLDWPYAVEQPVAPAIRDWALAVAHEVSATDRLTLRVDVLQETTGEPGAEHPETIVLRHPFA